MTAVGRAVRREVGLFIVGGSVLEGSWSLHKVELCVSSWREVGPFIKVEICLKNFEVASSLVCDFHRLFIGREVGLFPVIIFGC